MIEIRSPKTESEWEAYYNLRYVELRKPWNQPRGSERVLDDWNSYQFGAFEGVHLLGVSMLQEKETKLGQVRFMAVSNEAQGKGIGRKIMESIEDKALELGLNELILQSREIAVPFYKALGYQLEEKTHLLFGEIQHYLMKKSLSLPK